MATVNCYISFNGTCEDAFNFYKSVFGGDFTYLGRYRDMPAEHPLPESEIHKIMHISLPISQETILMGADSSSLFGSLPTVGDNISLSINTKSEEEAQRLFEQLSKGGSITMPLEKTFWGALFGTFTDKFGINWMVNYDYETHKEK